MYTKTLKIILKKVLPDSISSKQTAYVKNRHIGESGRLISDIIEIAKIKKIEGFLVTMDIEKAFDSLHHKFLIYALEKIWFWQKFYNIGKDFIKKSGIMYFQWRYYHKVFSVRKRHPSKQCSFSLFIFFSLRDLISAHKIKT